MVGMHRGGSVRLRDMKSVGVLMVDTRSPTAVASMALRSDWSFGSAGGALERTVPFFLTYWINSQFAARHGYALRFYQLQQSGCVHPRWGSRHASYCKLAAVADAVSSGHFDMVVYLDSDAFWEHTKLSLPAMLHTYGGAWPSLRAPLAFFGWDSPYTLGPNAGVFVLDSHAPETRELLSVWWNVYSGQYGLKHSYEQHALQWQVMHLDRFSRRLETLRLRTMEPNTSDAVVHLDHNAGTKTRLWLMARAAVQILAAESAQAVGGKRERRRLRKLLPIFEQPRALVRTEQRRAALSAIVSAVSLHINRSQASFGGVDAEGRLAGLVPAFNATTAAARLLRLRPSEASRSLDGMPLSLINCSTDAWLSTWQSWRRVSTSIAAEAKRVCKKCRKDRGEETGKASALRQTVDSFALAASDEHCLALGATRAPKLPFAPLAALARCALASSNTVSQTSASVPLQYTLSSGQLGTVNRLRTLRSSARVLSPSCGFWPNCSGVRIVQPKDCWARLDTNLDACGETESALMLLLRRGASKRGAAASQSWNSVAIGPSGPVPKAALTAAAGDRLCLGRWRSHEEVGTNAVFANCPRAKSAGFHAWRVESFAWELLPAPHVRDAVRIVPRQAPHLCVSASPLHTTLG